MDINPINPISIKDSEPAELHKEKVPADKCCIYFKEIKCQIPDCKMKACAACPKNIKIMLQDLFSKIVGNAILLLNRDKGQQATKVTKVEGVGQVGSQGNAGTAGNSGASGAAGAGGAGGSGGGSGGK